MTDRLRTPDDRPLSKSQTSIVYEQIRADILAGRLAPGERLRILELAQSLEVSAGAIREALSRLVPEQLVVSRDQKGFVVAPVSIDDLKDLTDLRCDVESIALRRSVDRGDDGWEAAIVAAAHRLGRLDPRAGPDGSSTAEWVARHGAFHSALVSGCASKRLIDLHEQLYEQSERYRGLSAHVDSERDVPAEHRALTDAALDRDADRLVDLMVAHIRKTTELILAATAELRQD